MSSQLQYGIVTVAMGRDRLRVFADVTLPCMLAPGNLPALARHAPVTWHIHATEFGEQTIRTAPACRRLLEFASVEFHTLELERVRDLRSDEIVAHSLRRSSAIGRSRGEVLIHVEPDWIFASESMRRVHELVVSGHAAVAIASPRANRGSALAQLERDWMALPEAHGSLSNRALMRLWLENLHPDEVTRFFDDGLRCSRPSPLYWRVGDGGVLARAFQLHALMVRPERWQWNGRAFESPDLRSIARSTAGSNARPSVRSSIYVVRDSDDVAAVQLSACESQRLRRFGNTSARIGVASVADWLRRFGGDLQGFSERPIRFHTDEVDDPGERVWRAAEAESDQVLRQVSVVRAARGSAELGAPRIQATAHSRSNSS